jgi:hypothetical protein
MQVSIPKTAASIFGLSRRTVEYAEVSLRVGRLILIPLAPWPLEVLFFFASIMFENYTCFTDYRLGDLLQCAGDFKFRTTCLG